jgi:hypothetical protein
LFEHGSVTVSRELYSREGCRAEAPQERRRASAEADLGFRCDPASPGRVPSRRSRPHSQNRRKCQADNSSSWQ